MSGFTTSANQHLIRSNLWSTQLKEILEDELYAQKWVKMLSDFPDGDTLNIPSIGQAEANDYVENEPVKYTKLDEGNFTFTIDQYKSSATYITKKHMQDAYYTSQLMASFVPKQARAIGKAMEVNALKVGATGQTSADPNTINGASHRIAGSNGTTADAIAIDDFSKANYALNMANVPVEGRIAIVDPSVEYTLTTLTSVTNATNNPKWSNVVTDGLMNGLTAMNMNVFGFDIYVSQNLHKNTASETISGNAVADGVNNLFFSTAGDAMPIVGAVRQAPEVDSEYNKDRQREEYVTTARYGHKLYRPEGLVVCVTDSTVVPA
jgi:hypothetical protein